MFLLLLCKINAMDKIYFHTQRINSASLLRVQTHHSHSETDIYPHNPYVYFYMNVCVFN